ncbi:MAG: M28 family peptidase [Blastocatellia bacterium]|nr:M28 family peptidase [Blastocatellia bacterium]
MFQALRNSDREIHKWRKRLKRILMWLSGMLLLLLFAVWFVVTQPFVIPERVTEQPLAVDAKRLETHVRMLSETFHPRDAEHPENLNRVAAYIAAELKTAGGVVTEQPFEARKIEYRNVIATFGPDTPERIVIGAHYDSCGPRPGADDNASGVAVLLELARHLGTTKLPLRVELVAYTLEEPPFFETEFMGSAVHAKSLKEKGVKVRLMVSLEMLGYFSDAPNSQQFPLKMLGLIYPTTGNFVTVVGNLGQCLEVRKVKKAMLGASALPVCSINVPATVPGIDYSDHLNYWAKGYPAVMITDTSFYRNFNYHTELDTAEKLDYRRMAQATQGVYATVLKLAQ